MAQNNQSLSYLLTLNLIFLIKGSSAGLYSRLNGIAMTYSLVMAMTGEARKKKAGEGLAAKLGIICELVELKRKSYYPSLEAAHKDAEYSVDERAPYEAELYEILTELLVIIEDESLISQESIGEAWASSFSESGGMKNGL
jgi:hypothetical protein